MWIWSLASRDVFYIPAESSSDSIEFDAEYRPSPVTKRVVNVGLQVEVELLLADLIPSHFDQFRQWKLGIESESGVPVGLKRPEDIHLRLAVEN